MTLRGIPTPAPRARLRLEDSGLLDWMEFNGADTAGVEEGTVEGDDSELEAAENDDDDDDDSDDVVEVETLAADLDKIVASATPMIVRVVGEPRKRS